MKLPARFGTAGAHRGLVRTLGLHDPLPPLPGSADAQAPFDVSEFIRQQKIGVATATREWGWEGRGTWRESATEYYWANRELRFAQSRRALLEHVVREFNRLLQREQIGVQCRITGTDSDTLERAIVDIEADRLPLLEALDLAFGRTREA